MKSLKIAKLNKIVEFKKKFQQNSLKLLGQGHGNLQRNQNKQCN